MDSCHGPYSQINSINLVIYDTFDNNLDIANDLYNIFKRGWLENVLAIASIYGLKPIKLREPWHSDYEEKNSKSILT